MASQVPLKGTKRQKYEMADVFKLYGGDYKSKNNLPISHLKVIRCIEICRTSVLGGHVKKCDNCEKEQISYNSCRNRHCPKCQSITKEKWIAKRTSELLPTPYFHLVFTLPHDLNPIILCNRKEMLSILFSAVSETLQVFAKDPQWKLEGNLGFIAVLHTWSQVLLDHFHLHCLIPGGALSLDKKKWNSSRDDFLFKVKSLALEFRKRYINKFENLFKKNKLIFPLKTKVFALPNNFADIINTLRNKEWIAYAKKPFAGPNQVIKYLGRYTHKIAISNSRIKSIHDGKISFTYRDRSDDNKEKLMTLDADEFIRRFLLHVLPDGFLKIRYFGFLAHRNKKECLALIRKLINPEFEVQEKEDDTVQEIMLELTGIDIDRCPYCKKGRLIIIKELPEMLFPHTQIGGDFNMDSS